MTLMGARQPWAVKEKKKVKSQTKPNQTILHLPDDLIGRVRSKEGRTRNLIEWNVLSNHAAQAVDEGREGDGTRSIAVAPNLSSCPSKVKHSAPLW